MLRRFQFGFEHWAVWMSTAQILLLDRPHLHSVVSRPASWLGGEGFALAVQTAVATAIAISIAVAHALTAGNTLRALRVLCRNASIFMAAKGAGVLGVGVVPFSFLTGHGDSAIGTAAGVNRYVRSRQGRTVA